MGEERKGDHKRGTNEKGADEEIAGKGRHAKHEIENDRKMGQEDDR